MEVMSSLPVLYACMPQGTLCVGEVWVVCCVWGPCEAKYGLVCQQCVSWYRVLVCGCVLCVCVSPMLGVCCVCVCVSPMLGVCCVGVGVSPMWNVCCVCVLALCWVCVVCVC